MFYQRDHPLSVSVEWGECQRQTFFTIFLRCYIPDIRLFCTQAYTFIPWGHLQTVTIFWMNSHHWNFSTITSCSWWCRENIGEFVSYITSYRSCLLQPCTWSALIECRVVVIINSTIFGFSLILFSSQGLANLNT